MKKTNGQKIMISNKSINHLDTMINDIKKKGNHCKIEFSILLDWIIEEYKINYFKQKNENLYYYFLDDDLFRKDLLKSSLSLDEINSEIKNLIKKRKSVLKKGTKLLKKQDIKIKPKTSASEERKVQFE